MNLGKENYFNQSLKLLNGLLVSGNMPNLAAGSLPPTKIAPEVSSKNFLQVNGKNISLEVLKNSLVQVDLVNLYGSVEKTLFRGNASGALNLSTDGVKSGVYVLRVREGASVWTRTLRLGL